MSETDKRDLAIIAFIFLIAIIFYCLVNINYNDGRIKRGKKFIIGSASYKCEKINEL